MFHVHNIYIFWPWWPAAGDKNQIAPFSAKKTSSVSRGPRRRAHRNRCFIPPYSLITMEANSTNGFLTISQMMKESNKEGLSYALMAVVSLAIVTVVPRRVEKWY